MSTDTDAIDERTVAATDAPSRSGDVTLALLFEERCEEIIGILSLRWWKWRRPWDPERRANLARILADLGEARRLEAARRLPEGARVHLRTLLRRRIATLTFDGILELRDELRKALIPIGDDTYLEALLEAERARQREYDSADGAAAPLLWRDLDGAGQGLGDAPAARLRAFSEGRREQYRGDRKGVQLRQQVMLALLPVLALLTVGIAIVSALLIDRSDAGELVLLVVCAGAVGALLGSVRPLREELAAGAQLRSFLPGVLVQPLLGAVAGLLLLLVGETGVLGTTTADGDVWARAGLLAFAAGFVEPLLLRAVSRIAGIPGNDIGTGPAATDRVPNLAGGRLRRDETGRRGKAARVRRDPGGPPASSG